MAAGSKGLLRRRGHPVVVSTVPQPRGTLEHVHNTLQSPTARIVGAHANGACRVSRVLHLAMADARLSRQHVGREMCHSQLMAVQDPC